MTRKQTIQTTLARLAEQEQAFLRQSFLAPVLRAGRVQVRIAGVRCELRVRPNFQGWGVFRPVSHAEAALERTASLAERRRYLELFPALRLILCQRDGQRWLASPANAADGRFESATAPLPVWLVDEADRFDTIVARFDGRTLWFDQVEPRAEPGMASYLRQALLEPVAPDDLARPGLTREHRLAYTAAYRQRIAVLLANERLSAESRLREALAHAGAIMRDYRDVGNGFHVTYEVDGRRHVSVVAKRDLTVTSAGICLSGYDRQFDLGSLVGVLRESNG